MGNETVYSSRLFVRVTVSVSGGKKKTLWAEKLRDGVYHQVNSEGEREYGGKIRFFVGRPSDIIREQPARLNLKYGELEVVNL